MFRRDENNYQKVEVTVDGSPRQLQAGVSVAAALLAEGELISRISPSSGEPCGPHCLMGVCYECLMEIDGIHQQACTVEIRDGMKINRNLS